MYGYVLQDWLTIGNSATTTVIQNESDWLALSSFQDVAFWIDVRSVSAGTVTLAIQTAPTKDDALFSQMTNCSVAATSTPAITVVKNILSTNPAFPLATWVRWTLTPSVAATITFRILASANRVTA
ncbi:hypothetical protein BH09MYX1_BH09MYX1_58480 [soil metagenome]